MFFSKVSAAAAILLVTLAEGHMLLKTPIPYKTPDNSPLSSDGSNFPCRLGSGPYIADTVNTYPAGSVQQLAFTGTAVHGGGSCQISVTYDNPPPKDPSKWKVIKSIIGGCPGLDGKTNTYSFTVPKNLPSGKATLGWSWMNKIGNREFYMNCAPVEITGGASDASALTKLPELYVANLAITKNVVPEGTNAEFPNPGAEVERAGGVVGGAPKVSQPVSTLLTSPSRSPSPSPSPSPSSVSPVPTLKPTASTLKTIVSTLKPTASRNATSAKIVVIPLPKTTLQTIRSPFFTIPIRKSKAVTATIETMEPCHTAAPPSPPTASPTASPTVSPTAPAPAPAPPAGNTTVPIYGGNSPVKLCDKEGVIFCSSDAVHFGICANGKLTWQAVASGTKCINGQIVRAEDVVTIN